jgi:hypothetical protein
MGGYRAPNGGEKERGERKKKGKGKKGRRTFRVRTREISFGIVHDYNYICRALIDSKWGVGIQLLMRDGGMT